MPGADPGIPDRCVSINPGSPYFWESGDILLNPATTPGTAQTGANAVEVTVRKAADCQVTGAVLVDLFVCNPSVGVVPPGVIPNASKQITNTDPTNPDTFIANGNAIPAAGQTVAVTWTVAAGTPPTAPDGAGHRCLVARCYPLQGSSPDAGDFHVQTGPGQGDQHVAQKNISIVASRGMERRPFHFIAPNPGPAAEVVVRAAVNLHPGEGTLAVLLPMLQKVPGFRRIADRPPKGFRLFSPDFPNAQPRPLGGCLGWLLNLLGLGPAATAVELPLPVPPRTLAGCVLELDPSATQPGDAHVFNLTQTAAGGTFHGGLTVVMVRE
jgi:hypothetical protein